MTEKLPGDFGANWSTGITVVVVVGIALIAGGAHYLPIWSAQRAVTERLFDPTAVLFRNVQKGRDGVCGEVNGKNRFGAYVGYTRFVVTADGFVYIDGSDGREASTRWTTHCS